MEIEVGEYGRTNLGTIIKFAWLECERGIIDDSKVILVDKMHTSTKPYYYFKKHEIIVKHSKKTNRLNRSRRLCKWKRSKTYCYV